ncbi:MAG: hypothetical protein E6G33_11700, partial [Actinobacteria bacterium]
MERIAPCVQRSDAEPALTDLEVPTLALPGIAQEPRAIAVHLRRVAAARELEIRDRRRACQTALSRRRVSRRGSGLLSTLPGLGRGRAYRDADALSRGRNARRFRAVNDTVNEVRAAVMTRPGELEVRMFPVPEPELGAVLMRVRLSGICGTDKHTFRGETIQYAGTPHERHIEYPLICGHENIGVVEATGGEVGAADGTPLRPGDRIVPGANVPCGACWYCLSRQPYYLCERMEDYGNSLNIARVPSLFGGWSELMYLLPGTPIFRVPAELPDELAVLTEV